MSTSVVILGRKRTATRTLLQSIETSTDFFNTVIRKNTGKT